MSNTNKFTIDFLSLQKQLTENLIKLEKSNNKYATLSEISFERNPEVFEQNINVDGKKSVYSRSKIYIGAPQTKVNSESLNESDLKPAVSPPSKTLHMKRIHHFCNENEQVNLNETMQKSNSFEHSFLSRSTERSDTKKCLHTQELGMNVDFIESSKQNRSKSLGNIITIKPKVKHNKKGCDVKDFKHDFEDVQNFSSQAKSLCGSFNLASDTMEGIIQCLVFLKAFSVSIFSRFT